MNDQQSEQAVRELVERWHALVAQRDLAGILACYDPDVVAYDAIGSLRFVGLDAYAEHWENCLAMMPEIGGVRLHSQTVRVSGDLAVAWLIQECSGPDDDGNLQTGWMRGTMCLQRGEGGWKIVHEHYSMPADMETGKMVFDAVP